MSRTSAFVLLAALFLFAPRVHAAEANPIPPKDQLRLPWQLESAGDVFTAFVVRSTDANTVTVQIGQPGRRPVAGPAEVTCRVYGLGGRLLATQTGRCGETVSFDSADWDSGPYEIRFFPSTSPRAMASPVVRWFKGDMLAAARDLIRQHGPGAELGKESRRLSPEMQANCRMLAELVLDRLGGNAEATAIPPNAVNSIHSALMEYGELQLAAAGKVAQVRGRGFFRLAYKDEVDDSWQFCRVYLPPDYDAKRRWPLVVILHGYYPANPPYVRWWDVDRRQHSLAENHGVIVIEPHARGNSWYGTLGERDVLHCIQQVQQRLSVHPDRILLMGYSMGGGGAWSIGTRHPHRFAAVAPIFGGWDYRATITTEDYARLTPIDHLLSERSSSFVQAETLLNTPVFVNHGDDDELVSIDNTHYAVRMLQRWGYDVRYWEHPDLGHGGLNCEDEILRWFLPRRRAVDPKRVRVRSAELKSARAHWLAVEQREDPLKLILADAQIVNLNTIRLNTQNVLQVRLSPKGELIDPAKPIVVIWNNTDLRTVPMNDGQVVLQSQGFTPAELCKTPGREGPVCEYQTTPFAIILGTIADTPQMHAALQHRANALAHAWETWQKTKPRFFSDNSISDEELARYSLLLVGGPRENLVARKLADRIPLQIAEEQITIDGRAFPVKDAAVQMIYPHPLNRERYVVVVAATSPKALFFAVELPENVDFAITDGRISPRLAEIPSLRGNDRVDPLALVASGFFDHNWRFNEKYLISGDANLRSACAVRKIPRYTMAPQDQKTLFLSDLLEADAEGNFSRMRRDLNYLGRPLMLGGKAYANGLSGQILREAPSYVEFNIAPGPWKRLRGLIGIEVKPMASQVEKERTSILFIVRGDGKELYRSAAFRYSASPCDLDVDITGVRRLRLEVTGEGRFNAATSCNWCDLRIEQE